MRLRINSSMDVQIKVQNQIISSPDAIIIPGADSLLTMFPEV